LSLNIKPPWVLLAKTHPSTKTTRKLTKFDDLAMLACSLEKNVKRTTAVHGEATLFSGSAKELRKKNFVYPRFFEAFFAYSKG
jgi:hypothetical protein